MATSLAYIRDELAGHPLAQWFRISIVSFGRDRLVLGLVAQDESIASACDSAGLCALLVDYGARKLGYEALGCCFVNECEISIHQRLHAQEWQLLLSLDSVAAQDASFACQVLAQTSLQPLVVAEAQGTLCRG
jgi:hypothetical protein